MIEPMKQESNNKNARFVTEGYEPAGYQIKPGCPAPDIVVIVVIKDLIHLYFCAVRGMGCLSQSKLATVRTALSCAERFFGGFEEALHIYATIDPSNDLKGPIALVTF